MWKMEDNAGVSSSKIKFYDMKCEHAEFSIENFIDPVLVELLWLCIARN